MSVESAGEGITPPENDGGGLRSAAPPLFLGNDEGVLLEGQDGNS